MRYRVIGKVLVIVLTLAALASMLVFLCYVWPELLVASGVGWVDKYIVGMIVVVFITIIVLGCIAVMSNLL